jgi:hypothetical protein
VAADEREGGEATPRSQRCGASDARPAVRGQCHGASGHEARPSQARSQALRNSTGLPVRADS